MLAAQLSDDGFVTEVVPADVNNQTYYRVMHGPLSQKEDPDLDLASYGITSVWWLSEPAPATDPVDMASMQSPIELAAAPAPMVCSKRPVRTDLLETLIDIVCW